MCERSPAGDGVGFIPTGHRPKEFAQSADKPAIRLNAVVLPALLGPINPRISPGFTWKKNRDGTQSTEVPVILYVSNGICLHSSVPRAISRRSLVPSGIADGGHHKTP
jgi:hypothetical protein